MVRRSRSRKSQRRRHRGGESPSAVIATASSLTNSDGKEAMRAHTKVGGGRRRSRRRHRGGSMLATAALPFGLFGLQKFFQKSRVNPLRRMGRSARRTIKRVF